MAAGTDWQPTPPIISSSSLPLPSDGSGAPWPHWMCWHPIPAPRWRIVCNQSAHDAFRCWSSSATVAARVSESGVYATPFRYGEAQHPGPPLTVVISSSNPSGLRNKESLHLDWGPGIHSFSETQLSEITLGSARKVMQSQARALERQVRIHSGAAAPVRNHSTWAGSWTGVLQASDYPSRVFQVPWPSGLFESGRVLLCQHFPAQLPITVASVYGYPSGPTWPQAQSMTDELLSSVTKHLILGQSGVRVVVGDFNHSTDSLTQCAVWRQHGWVEAQTLAAQLWGHVPQPTCKHSTHRDFVWLSPEAATLVSSVAVVDVYQEHSSVLAWLNIPESPAQCWTWALPAVIPWDVVDVDTWSRNGCHAPVESADSTVWYRSFGRNFERSLQGHVTGRPDLSLPPNAFGRGDRVQPQLHRPQHLSAKTCRPGEVALAHDGLALEVRRWYQQLRRLQSLRHATKHGRLDAPALDHRLALWRSILRGKGFKGGFSQWWPSRPLKLLGSPNALPCALPSASEAEILYQDFAQNFRHLERWHMQRKQQVVDALYDSSLTQLYREVRDPASQQVDCLTLRHNVAILAVSEDRAELQLEEPLDVRGSSSWTVDGTPVQVLSADGTVCALRSPLPVDVGEELEQVQTLSSASDLHDEFRSLWATRWQEQADIASDDWTRFLSFASAYLPHGRFELPSITVDHWLRAVKRFKPRAARGPDGWARDDLLHMPPERIQQLLNFLDEIESSARPWPRQLLVGLLCLLDKRNGRTDAQAFRPICLFSIVYRTWAGIRSRQLLRILAPQLPAELMGFIPGRSAVSLWLAVQADIELAAQTGASLSGYCTDVVKCFNALPRLPLLAMASQVGVPWTVVAPWSSFLASVERRVLIRGQVGPPIGSTRGFPEGCPLSPLAMVLATWAYHRYMSVFAPAVRSLSFVDNWSCVAPSPAALAQGVASTTTFASSLHLELDQPKTYVWSVLASDRPALEPLGCPVALFARDLGGIFSFVPAVRNAALKLRCKTLVPVWSALRRSRAPLWQKLTLLYTKCWPRALHGSSGCPLAESELQSLRATATSALRIRPGGSSSLLRLNLGPTSLCDPGFYQIWHCVLDFRQVAASVPQFVGQWRCFMSRLDGRPLHGPFTKLLQMLGQVAWSLGQPPLVHDHEGLPHDLLQAPSALLFRQLEAGWLRHVASRHTHRQTMRDLDGLDPALLRADIRAHSPLDASRVAALRSGAFIFGAEQSRFDQSQTGLCPRCSQPDTAEHRVRFCPRFQSVRAQHQWVCDLWPSLPMALTHHLLPCANPALSELHMLLHSLEDLSGVFFCSGSGDAWFHLFTDGACRSDPCPELALAAWGLILHGAATPVACGPVPGILQTAPRAELYAVIAAARWTLTNAVRSMVWSDAKTVVDGIAAIRAGTAQFSENEDLWARLDGLLDQLPADRFVIHHVPSHLDPAKTESPIEDWLLQGNSHADTLAVFANHNRPQVVLDAHARALQYHVTTLEQLRALKALYMGIADITAGRSSAGEGEAEHETSLSAAVPVPAPLVIEDELCVGWRQVVCAHAHPFPPDFVLELCQFLFELDSAAEETFRVSWLELVFILDAESSLVYPVAGTQGKWLSAASLAFRPLPPTVAARVSLLRKVMRRALQCLQFQGLLASAIDCSELGVLFRVDGMLLGVAPAVLAAARSRVRDFCTGRRVTGPAGLARPLR